MSDMDETSASGIARNEALFRELNERIKLALGSTTLSSEKQDFVCECGKPGCFAVISMTYGEYENLRENPRWFGVLDGHDLPDLETVVQRCGPYNVVQKKGVGGRRG
ncbi:MAG: hypothetical protein ABR575_03985 [Actinomycetota bacterium]